MVVKIGLLWILYKWWEINNAFKVDGEEDADEDVGYEIVMRWWLKCTENDTMSFC